MQTTDMAGFKTYLNVPYAQKDAAKALGARWDPLNKKWYVPAGKDIAPFAQWNTVSDDTPTKPNTTSVARKSNDLTKGVYTYPTIEDFEAYNGAQPPWD